MKQLENNHFLHCMFLSYVIDVVFDAGWRFKWLRADGGINNARPNSHLHEWCYNGDFIILIMTTGGKKKRQMKYKKLHSLIIQLLSNLLTQVVICAKGNTQSLWLLIITSLMCLIIITKLIYLLLLSFRGFFCFLSLWHEIQIKSLYS